MQAEKAARLLTKGSTVRIQGRMSYPTWTDRASGETRYGAEIVAQTLDYQDVGKEEAPQVEQVAEVGAPQVAEQLAPAAEEAPAKPRRRRKQVQAAA
jgi:single-stranded DNA-binding protein